MDKMQDDINNDAIHKQNKRASTTRMRTGTLEDIPKINAIAAAYLGAEILEDRVIAGWLAANSEILRVIECDHNPYTSAQEWHLCGYYIVLPLIASVAELIKKNAIRHADIPPSAVQNYSNPLVSSLFFIDLMAHAPICARKYCGRITATSLMYDLYCRIQDFPQDYPHIKEVIAMPATRESKVLVKNLGFSKDCSYAGPQGWELWLVEIDKLAQTAHSLAKKLGNYLPTQSPA